MPTLFDAIFLSNEPREAFFCKNFEVVILLRHIS